MTLDRRSFLKLVGAGAGAAGAAGLPMIGMAAELMPKSGRRVVVIGGGYGGTIAAKYVRMLDKSIEVVMIERNKQFVSCPFSNFYIAGLTNDMNSLTIGYDKLTANHGVKMVYAEVTGIDPAAKKVVTDQGTLDYDRLIVSPGIDFRTEEIEGYDAKTAEIFPHAWKAGAQSTLLRNQLQSMKDGGTVIISMPLTPYRCPPGPYERSCLIAHYLKTHKPKSKLILLDANPDVVSKKPLFTKAWSTYYKDNFQYIGGKKITKADTGAKLVSVEGIEDFKGDVINLIPPSVPATSRSRPAWSATTRSGARSMRSASSPPSTRASTSSAMPRRCPPTALRCRSPATRPTPRPRSAP
jgi:sulfide dehydrogenase [flavocytochrome c] flavoprotein subunit